MGAFVIYRFFLSWLSYCLSICNDKKVAPFAAGGYCPLVSTSNRIALILAPPNPFLDIRLEVEYEINPVCRFWNGADAV